MEDSFLARAGLATENCCAALRIADLAQSPRIAAEAKKQALLVACDMLLPLKGTLCPPYIYRTSGSVMNESGSSSLRSLLAEWSVL